MVLNEAASVKGQLKMSGYLRTYELKSLGGKGAYAPFGSIVAVRLTVGVVAGSMPCVGYLKIST